MPLTRPSRCVSSAARAARSWPRSTPTSLTDSKRRSLLSKTPRQRPSGGKTLAANVEGLQVGDTTTQSGSAAQPESQSTETPKYLQLERPEARLRSDQVDGLARLRRLVEADPSHKSEQIPDNTRIRTAVDRLLTPR